MAAIVYAVVNRKGGVGKTTTAISLAHGLSRKLNENGGGNVLLVDLDPQGNVAAALGVQPKAEDVSELLLGTADAADVIVTAGKARPGLYVLPASSRLKAAKAQLLSMQGAAIIARQFGGSMPNEVDLDLVLNDRLDMAKKAFNYIIIDCPPSLDHLDQAVYRFADRAIVPVKPDYLGATGTRQHTQEIIEAQGRGIDITIELIVPTFFRRREVLAREMLLALVQTYGRNKISAPVPQAVVLEQAPASGQQTVFEFAPESPAAAAYDYLVRQVYRRAKP